MRCWYRIGGASGGAPVGSAMVGIWLADSPDGSCSHVGVVLLRVCAPQDAGACFARREILDFRQPASAGRFLPLPPWAVFARPAILHGWTLRRRKRLSGSSVAGVIGSITGGPLSCSRSETVCALGVYPRHHRLIFGRVKIPMLLRSKAWGTRRKSPPPDPAFRKSCYFLAHVTGIVWLTRAS
jgi:hypothetical protein